MIIKLVDGKEYELEQFFMSSVTGEENTTILTFHLSNKITDSEFFEVVEQDFTEHNTKEILLLNGDSEIKFSPKTIISKSYSTNAYGNQTTVVFKN